MTLTRPLLALLTLILGFPEAAVHAALVPWETLAAGVELGRFPMPTGRKGDVIIVRIDPQLAPLKLLACADLGHASLPADQWAVKHGLAVVINAGMFDVDQSTHVGFMKNHETVGQPQVRKDYSSVAAFSPVKPGEPAFHIFDTEDADLAKEIARDYHVVVQNLRLIKHSGENRWPQQPKAWSEAALGEDGQGRALFIFCAAGLSMHDFNAHLLTLPIDLRAAQHLDGGPVASLYVKCGTTELGVMGSYETGFTENDENKYFWPIPNVIAVAVKTTE